MTSVIFSGKYYSYPLGLFRKSATVLYAVVRYETTSGVYTDMMPRVYKSSNNGSSWVEQDTGNAPTSGSGGVSNIYGHAKLAGDGKLWVFWNWQSSEWRFTYFDTTTDTWGGSSQVFVNSFGSYMFCLDNNDKLHQAYSSGTNVYHTEYTSGSGWSTGEQVNGSHGQSTCRPVGIDVDDDGNVYVAYSCNSGGYYLGRKSGGSWSQSCIYGTTITMNDYQTGRLVKKSDGSLAYIFALDYHTSDDTWGNYYQSYLWIFKSEDYTNWSSWKSAIINTENTAHHMVGFDYYPSAIHFGNYAEKVSVMLDKLYSLFPTSRMGLAIARENYADNGDNMTHHLTNIVTAASRSSGQNWTTKPVFCYDIRNHVYQPLDPDAIEYLYVNPSASNSPCYYSNVAPVRVVLTPPAATFKTSGSPGNIIWYNYAGTPYEDTSAGGWKDDQLRTAPLYEAINEENRDDSKFIQSPDNPANQIAKVHIRPMSVPDFNGMRLCYSYSHNQASGTYNLKVRLKEGTTTIAEFTHTNIPHTWTYVEQTLTVEQCQSVTDWYNTYIEFEAY